MSRETTSAGALSGQCFIAGHLALTRLDDDGARPALPPGHNDPTFALTFASLGPGTREGDQVVRGWEARRVKSSATMSCETRLLPVGAAG